MVCMGIGLLKAPASEGGRYIGGSEHRLKPVLLFADLKVGQYIWLRIRKNNG